MLDALVELFNGISASREGRSVWIPIQIDPFTKVYLLAESQYELVVNWHGIVESRPMTIRELVCLADDLCELEALPDAITDLVKKCSNGIKVSGKLVEINIDPRRELLEQIGALEVYTTAAGAKDPVHTKDARSLILNNIPGPAIDPSDELAKEERGVYPQSPIVKRIVDLLRIIFLDQSGCLKREALDIFNEMHKDGSLSIEYNHDAYQKQQGTLITDRGRIVFGKDIR